MRSEEMIVLVSRKKMLARIMHRAERRWRISQKFLAISMSRAMPFFPSSAASAAPPSSDCSEALVAGGNVTVGKAYEKMR